MRYINSPMITAQLLKESCNSGCNSRHIHAFTNYGSFLIW